MAKGLDLGLPSYMGRGIITGITADGLPADIYFAEGRSPPSRRRMLRPCHDEGMVRMDANSETTVDQMRATGGNPNLLLYDAMMGDADGILVMSNGFQTNCDAVWEGGHGVKLVGSERGKGIYHRIKEGMPMYQALHDGLRQAGSEVDDLRTARIAAARDYDRYPNIVNIGIVIRPRNCTGKGAMEADDVRVDDGISSLKRGEFVVYATYGVHNPPYHAGLPPNISPLNGYTKIINLDATTPDQLVQEVWEGLPKEILVGVAAAMRDASLPKGFRFASKNVKE